MRLQADEVINDLTGVCSGGKWGFVDVSGNEIVLPKYDRVSEI